MAKRFRYAFAKKKEAAKGKLSLGLVIASFLLFVAAVLVSFFLGEPFGFLVGGLSVFGMLLSVYGFIMGLVSFSEENRKHTTSIIGSIVNGMVVIIWIGIFLTGVS